MANSIDITNIISIKRLGVWFGIFLSCFLLRGPLSRQFITYHAEKPFVLRYKIENPQLTNFILKHPEVYDRNVEDINHIALIAHKITADVLTFSKDSTAFNPNILFQNGGIASDAGYSAFYSTVCNFLIDYYSLKEFYHCRHLVGSCFFRHTNLSTVRTLRGGQPFPSEFHFNVIVNLKTGETISVDPTLYDAYRISTVSTDYIIANP